MAFLAFAKETLKGYIKRSFEHKINRILSQFGISKAQSIGKTIGSESTAYESRLFCRRQIALSMPDQASTDLQVLAIVFLLVVLSFSR